MSKDEEKPRNSIEFRVWGRYAMFTDPLTRTGGEKLSYQLPTYEALKGICKSIYWKPTFIWVVDQVRMIRRVRTQSRGMKPLDYNGVYPSMKDPSKEKERSFNTLSIYTYLTGDARRGNPDGLTNSPGVEYQVRAHFRRWQTTELKANIMQSRSAASSSVAAKMSFWARETAKVM